MTEQATADALVDAAERRFAADGFDGASLRAVMRDAEADPGAVPYHFGGRESLAAAVLDRVLGPLNRRLELLDAATADSADALVPLERLVDALVRPDIEVATDLHGHGTGRAQLIGTIYLDRASFVQEEVAKHFAPTARRFMPHLCQALAGISGSIESWRVRWFVFGVLGALLSDGHARAELAPGELVDRLVCSLCAALAASVSEEGPSWK